MDTRWMSRQTRTNNSCPHCFDSGRVDILVVEPITSSMVPKRVQCSDCGTTYTRWIEEEQAMTKCVSCGIEEASPTTVADEWYNVDITIQAPPWRRTLKIPAQARRQLVCSMKCVSLLARKLVEEYNEKPGT